MNKQMTVVPYEGPIEAAMAVVGEAPGAMEVAKGRPFAGPAGQMQDRCMSQVPIIRSRVRMMNLMQVRPPGNDFNHFWEDKQGTVPKLELVAGIATLRDALLTMPNLKVIVAYGRQPMFVLTHQDGITNCRGSVYPCKMEGLEHVWVVSTFHPSFALRTYEIISLIVHDLKVAKQVEKEGYKPVRRSLVSYPSDKQIKDLLNYLEGETPLTAVDIECHEDAISRISLAYDPSYAMSIPFINLDTGEIISNREWVWDRLREVFKTLPVAGQNFTFDMIWLLKKQGIVFGNLIHDTMVAQHKLISSYPQFLKPNSLAFLTSIYTDQPYYKDELKIVKKGRKKNELIDERYGNYSCMDASITKEAQIEQTKLLNADPYHKTKFEFEMKLINGPIMWMMTHGVRIDMAERDRLRHLYKKRLELLEYLIADELGRWINMRSPQQVSQLLYKDMGLTGTGSRSTNENCIKVLRAKYPDIGSLDYILDYRELEQIRKNILSATVESDGRMRCTYMPMTVGGRFASSSNPFGYGTNMQNIPRLKEIRNLFIPDPNMLFCECDLKGAELWPVAFLSEEPEMMRRLLNGDDLHIYNASIVFNKPEDQISTKGATSERTTGKTCFHGYNYGLGPNGLIKQMRKDHNINLNIKTAKLYLSRCHRGAPRIKNVWHMKVQDELIHNHKTIITCMGRKIQFLQRMNDDLLRKALSLNPRSTIADLLNEIMLEWFNRHNGDPVLGCQLLMQNHDAFSIQFPKDRMEQNLKALRGVFNRPISINGYTVTIPVEIVVSDRWKGEVIHEEVTRYE